MNGADDQVIRPPILDHPDGIVEGERLPLVGISIPACFETEVVCPAATFEGGLQFGSLSVRWEQAELEGFSHNVSSVLLILSVALEILLVDSTIFTMADPIPEASPPILCPYCDQESPLAADRTYQMPLAIRSCHRRRSLRNRSASITAFPGPHPFHWTTGTLDQRGGSSIPTCVGKHWKMSPPC